MHESQESQATRIVVSAVEGGPKADGLANLPEGSPLLRAAFQVAWENGLHCAFASHWVGVGRPLPSRERVRLMAESRTMDRLRRTLAALDLVSAAAHTPYAVIKNLQTMEHAPRDVDVFVDEADCGRFVAALRAFGFDLLYDDGAELSLGAPGTLRVDLYTTIRYLDRAFLDGAFLRGARKVTSTVSRLHPSLTPEASLLVNAIHSLFGHGGASLADFLEFRGLARLVGGPARCREMAARFGWAGAFDVWSRWFADLQSRVAGPDRVPRFPVRFGHRLTMEAAHALEDPALDPHRLRLLRASLWWDDLQFLAERTGLDKMLKRAAWVRRLVNLTGHRVRTARGDRKRKEHAAASEREETTIGAKPR